MWSKISSVGNIFQRTSVLMRQAGDKTKTTISTVAHQVRKVPSAVKQAAGRFSTKHDEESYIIFPTARHDRASSSKATTYIIVSIIGLTVASVAVLVGEWIYKQVADFRVAGILFAPVFVVILWFISRSIWLEVSSWRKLILIDSLRSDLSGTSVDSSDRQRFLAALSRLRTAIAEPHRSEIAAFAKTITSEQSLDDIRGELSTRVMRTMDNEAVTAVHRASRDMFYLALVSATPITDTVAFVTRAILMNRRIAFAYGNRPGKLGMFHIVRHVLADVALISVVMVVVGRASRAVGDVMGSFVSKVGDGISEKHPILGATIDSGGKIVGKMTEESLEGISDAFTASLRMAQLGLLAVNVIRPLELSESQRKKISTQLRRELFRLRHKTLKQQEEQAELEGDTETAAT